MNEPKKITEKFGFFGGNYLQSILDKQPDAVTEEEKDILRARISYLTPEQIKNYGLEKEKEPEPEPELEEEPEEESKSTKKKKK